MVSGSLRASSTTKTGRHDIAERLLKVALKHQMYNFFNCFIFTHEFMFVLFFVYFWCFNATFSNLSAISWRPVLVVEEARREPLTIGKQLVNFITCGCYSSAPFFVTYKSRARTHAVLVIGLYELLGNPTT
jgi:hypothetical protein